MTIKRSVAALSATALLLAGCTQVPQPDPSGSPSGHPSVPPSTTPAPATWSDAFMAWRNGPNPSGATSFWPIGVWMQNPDRVLSGQTSAQAYQAIGINTDVTINAWPGCAWCPGMEGELTGRPWDAMMWAGGDYRSSTFPGVQRAAAAPAVASRIKAWALDDEPDMRRPNDNSQDVYPTNFKAFGDKVRLADPTRPVYTNFGKGMAIPEWNGYHEEAPGGAGTYAGDMALYCASSDIVSADFYGWTDPYEAASQKGAYAYGRAVDNIRAMCGPDQLAYGFVEGSHPWAESTPAAAGSTITAAQMEAAIWNTVVHGANGLVYFAHYFSKGGDTFEDGLLRNAANRAKAAEVNAALKAIAPALNAKSVTGQIAVTSTAGVPVTFMHKQVGATTWLIAQADGNAGKPLSGATTATFTVSTSATSAEVVGESRTVPISAGKLTDAFGAYGHHVYRW